MNTEKTGNHSTSILDRAKLHVHGIHIKEILAKIAKNDIIVDQVLGGKDVVLGHFTVVLVVLDILLSDGLVLVGQVCLGQDTVENGGNNCAILKPMVLLVRNVQLIVNLVDELNNKFA